MNNLATKKTKTTTQIMEKSMSHSNNSSKIAPREEEQRIKAQHEELFKKEAELKAQQEELERKRIEQQQKASTL
jgi:hypothetical protein